MMTTESRSEKPDCNLREHEKECRERHIEIIRELSKKAEPLTPAAWILLFSVLVAVGLGIGGALSANIYYTASLAERVVRVEVGIDNLANKFDERFAAMDERFEAMDKRFAAMDKRFEAMDRRFDEMDRRFDDLKDTIIQALSNTDGAAGPAQSSR